MCVRMFTHTLVKMRTFKEELRKRIMEWKGKWHTFVLDSVVGKANKSEPQRFWTMQRRINHLSMRHTICQQSIKPWNYQLWQQSILPFSSLLYILILAVKPPPLQSAPPQESSIEMASGRYPFTEMPFEYPLFIIQLSIEQTGRPSSLNALRIQERTYIVQNVL